MTARVAAAEAFSRGDFGEVESRIEEVAGQLASAHPRGAAELAEVWKLERTLGAGTARFESLNWTKPMLTMADQLTLVLVLELAFGVIFELPLVMAVLGMLGLVRSGFLFKYQRHAFVACLVLAAIITPTGDVVNLSMMAGPMLLCYELGVLFVWLIERRRKKEEVAIVPS
jgi:sec-independent protein translocase protein TatC